MDEILQAIKHLLGLRCKGRKLVVPKIAVDPAFNKFSSSQPTQSTSPDFSAITSA